jgi:hypothetical protein
LRDDESNEKRCKSQARESEHLRRQRLDLTFEQRDALLQRQQFELRLVSFV